MGRRLPLVAEAAGQPDAQSILRVHERGGARRSRLSFQGTHIRKIGILQSYCYEAPKPLEFGNVGAYWDQVGWRVDVRYVELTHQIRPSEYMDRLRPLLPSQYSPLLRDGRGSQSIYLTEVPADLMHALADLIGHEARILLRAEYVLDQAADSHGKGLIEWEEHIRHNIETDDRIADTVKAQIIQARRGQGKFKEAVRQLEDRCRVTKVARLEHLRASHIKPWRDSSNEERLNGENGLLLTPNIDHLFDRGFVSFESTGRLLISPRQEPLYVGKFTEGQRTFLNYHRDEVFLESRIKR